MRQCVFSLAFFIVPAYCAVVPARAQEAQNITPQVVLVHGAFVDASSWRRVIPLLQARGITVAAVQNPLTSLADDVAATRRVMATLPGPIVLVGHSWGGAVITEVGDDEKVSTLVYIAALAPDVGEAASDVMHRAAPAPAAKEIIKDATGLLSVSAKGMAEDVAQDAEKADIAVLIVTQLPFAAQAFGQPVHSAAWHVKPSFYLIAENDRALPPDFERQTARGIGAKLRSVDSGHLVPMSQPEAVASIILEAVNAAGRNK